MNRSYTKIRHIQESNLKIIITEEQYENTLETNSSLWLRRRYDLVLRELEYTKDFTRDGICRRDTYEDFEHYFFSVFMDCLHPYYYEETHFNYEKFQSVLTDMFYVECTEFYFYGREKC